MKQLFKTLVISDTCHLLSDIGYMFQDMEALKAELSSDTEETQEYTQIINEMDTTVTGKIVEF